METGDKCINIVHIAIRYCSETTCLFAHFVSGHLPARVHHISTICIYV